MLPPQARNLCGVYLSLKHTLPQFHVINIAFVPVVLTSKHKTQKPLH